MQTILNNLGILGIIISLVLLYTAVAWVDTKWGPVVLAGYVILGAWQLIDIFDAIGKFLAK